MQEIYRRYPELYDIMHAEKDYKGEVEFIIDQYGDALEEARILDVGCGTGTHLSYLAEYGCDVTGIDANEAVLNVARQKCPEGTFYCDTLPELPEETFSEPFDIVLCLYNVLDLLPQEDLKPALRTLTDLVRDDGLFVFDISELPENGWGPALNMMSLETGGCVRLGKLEQSGEQSFQMETAIFAQDADGFDFFIDRIDFSQYEIDNVVKILGELGYEADVHAGYNTKSVSDDLTTVFVATPTEKYN